MPAVGEQRLDLDALHQRPHPVEHVLLPQDVVGPADDLGVAQAVARELAHAVRDDGGGLGLVELQAAAPARPRQLGGEEEQEPVLLGREEPHGAAPA